MSLINHGYDESAEYERFDITLDAAPRSNSQAHDQFITEMKLKIAEDPNPNRIVLEIAKPVGTSCFRRTMQAIQALAGFATP